ncbi:MAG: sigma-70 family RNA polymerase sigma factor [Bacteroidota bacterium]
MNHTTKNTSEAKIAAIKRGGLSLEKVMRELYQSGGSRTQILEFVQKRGGSRDDAEDVFQEGVRNLVLNIRADKFAGASSLEGYLFGICRNVWFKKLQKQKREAEILEQYGQQEKAPIPDPEIVLVDQDRENKLLELLGKLGETCKEVLVLWQMHYNMKEIASRMGYASEGMARKKKHQCLKRLVALIEANPAWEAILEE